jgi:FkbM family methyltransferase
VFIDVGANTGFYSLLAACTGAPCVHAFEPVPDIGRILSANIGQSGLQAKIKIYMLGLGATVGSFPLYLPNAAHGLIETSASLNKDFRHQHSGQMDVAVTTLDAFADEDHVGLLDKPLLIKIDVETLEPAVIRGGLRFIQKYRPVMAVEILPEGDAAFFERFCEDHQYCHVWLLPGQALHVSSGRIETRSDLRDHLLIPSERAAELMGLLGQ